MSGSASRRLYRLLLLLLPRDLRVRFGRDMEQLFVDRLSEVQGVRARARLWAALVVDVLTHAALERLSRLATLPHLSRRARRMDTMIGHDFKQALQRWRRAPVFGAMIVAILSLGMGVNIAVFALVDATLLRPLPFEAGDEVVHFWQESRADGSLTNFSHPIFLDLGARARTLEGVAGYHSPSMTLTRGDGARSVETVRVSPGFFALLGVDPALGRDFRPEDATVGAGRVTIVSNAFWRTELGGEPDVLGRALVLDGQPYTLIGVLPAEFVFPRERRAEVWRPLVPSEREASARGLRWMHVIGRLGPGVDLPSAQREMDRLAAEMEVEAPEANGGRGLRLISMRDQVVGETRPALLAVFAAVLVVLLITCSNVAHLVFVRVLGRRADLGVRRALGATRGQIVRHVTIEVLVLFLLGGAGAAVVSSWLLRAVPALLPPDAMAQAPFLGELSVDTWVLAYTCGVAVLGGLAFGLLTAARVASLEERGGLVASRRVIARGGTRLLVASQVAIAVALLASTFLLVRSSRALLGVDPGFDADDLMTLRISLPPTTYDDPALIAQFNEELVRRVETMPDVLGAAAVDRIPLSGNLATTLVRVPGEGGEAEARAANQHVVSPGYFDVMGMRVVGGRPLQDGDDAAAPRVAVVNELLAAALFGQQSPLGRTLILGMGAQAPTLEIVGVTADVKVHTIEEPPAPALYLPVAQLPSNATGLVVRTRTRPDALVGEVRAHVTGIDPSLDIYEVGSMRQLIDRSPDVLKRTIPALLLSAFAAFATILVGVGVFAIVGKDVAGRTRELGVRRAVGASSVDIVRDVTTGTLVTVAWGIVAGSALAVASARLVRSLLFGVGAGDPLTLVATASSVLLVASLACVLPVRRALAVYPTEALRSE